MDWVSASFIMLGILLVAGSASTFYTWADFERTRGIGPVDYTLKASCDPIGFEYEIRTEPSGGGLIGGDIGGGMTIGPVRKTYPQARGEFLDNLGVTYDSYRTRSYVYELIMMNPPQDSGIAWDGSGSPRVYLNVSLHSDIIPFWRESAKNDIDVTVTLMGHDLEELLNSSKYQDFSVNINSIEVLGRTGIDPATGGYTEDEVVLYSSAKGWTLKEKKESFRIDIGAEYPDGVEVMGVFVRIDASMTDFWGRGERQTLTGNANPINVRPLSTATLLKGAGIPFSSVLISLCILTSLLGILAITRRSAVFRNLCVISSIFGFGSVLWFYLGMMEAVSLLSLRLEGAEEGLSFGIGIYVCLLGSLVILMVGIVNIVRGILRKKKNRFKPVR